MVLYMYLTDSLVAILYSRLIQAYSDIVIEKTITQLVLFKHVYMSSTPVLLHHVKTYIFNYQMQTEYVVFTSYSVLLATGKRY